MNRAFNKILIKKSIFLIIAMFLCAISFNSVQALEIKHDSSVSANKEWNIKFSGEVHESALSEKKIYVKDELGNKVDITLASNNNIVKVIPKAPYKLGQKYTLVVQDDVKDVTGKLINEGVSLSFEVEDSKKFSDNHLVMAWENAHNKDAYNLILNDKNSAINTKAKDSALQIISPTMLKMKVENGEIVGVESAYSEEYLRKARENGYEIWPVIQMMPVNQSYGDFEKMVFKFLSNDKLVDKTINDIYAFIKKYELTGVNVDFEALGKSNKQGFSKFVEKLYVKLSKENIKVSACIPYPSEGSPYFNFIDMSSINKNSDYMIFMAYDERVVGAEVSGSISSYNWVEKGIKKLISLGASSEKLVLGVPLYTMDFAVVEGNPSSNAIIVTKRFVNGEQALLYSHKDGKNLIKELTYGDLFVTEDYQDEWYKVKYNGKSAYVHSKFVGFINANQKKEYAVGWNSVSMKQAEEIMKDPKYGAKITYDSLAKQEVLEYYKFDSANTVKLKHKMWLENNKSIEWRKELVGKYKLKGIGAWSLGRETSNIWSELYK